MALPAIGDGEQIGDGNSNETTKIGRSGVPLQIGGSAATTIGMYGATPVVQRATASSHTTIVTTVSVSTTGANMWGFSTSSQANTLTAAVAEIQATLVALGVWAA